MILELEDFKEALANKRAVCSSYDGASGGRRMRKNGYSSAVCMYVLALANAVTVLAHQQANSKGLFPYYYTN